ncbi:hypothetical protein H4R27_005187 [Coemansia aciculifera]|nr:hypothetical protein H4R27_005187 [Coemansia aciculifera]
MSFVLKAVSAAKNAGRAIRVRLEIARLTSADTTAAALTADLSKHHDINHRILLKLDSADWSAVNTSFYALEDWRKELPLSCGDHSALQDRVPRSLWLSLLLAVCLVAAIIAAAAVISIAAVVFATAVVVVDAGICFACLDIAAGILAVASVNTSAAVKYGTDILSAMSSANSRTLSSALFALMAWNAGNIITSVQRDDLGALPVMATKYTSMDKEVTVTTLLQTMAVVLPDSAKARSELPGLVEAFYK